MSSLRSRKGFTLIELLIVVVIIGILATILISKFSGTKEAAYVGQINAVAQQVGAAVGAYNALQTTSDVCDTFTKLNSMADDLVASMGQVNLAVVTGTAIWTISHDVSSKTATVVAATAVVTIASATP